MFSVCEREKKLKCARQGQGQGKLAEKDMPL